MSAWKVRDLGRTKRVHRAGCGMARTAQPYTWAGDKRVAELVAAIAETPGALGWHTACLSCANDLYFAVAEARKATI